MHETCNLTLSCLQPDKTRRALLEKLLDVAVTLHALDLGEHSSEAVERQLQRVHRKLFSESQLSQPHLVTRSGQLYLVTLTPHGVTYQPQKPLDEALQATASANKAQTLPDR
ncbi:hypothetical protein GCM10008949_31350 [Deinococcus humi]|nr:hypothetical protein GCM10008949_31350 [Deinococcus humi]